MTQLNKLFRKHYLFYFGTIFEPINRIQTLRAIVRLINVEEHALNEKLAITELLELIRQRVITQKKIRRSWQHFANKSLVLKKSLRIYFRNEFQGWSQADWLLLMHLRSVCVIENFGFFATTYSFIFFYFFDCLIIFRLR